jgi:hypothetical protein
MSENFVRGAREIATETTRVAERKLAYSSLKTTN